VKREAEEDWGRAKTPEPQLHGRLAASKEPPGIYAERPLRRTAGFAPVLFLFSLNA
jgi:hypothetical protein